jgi:hypothetical protein
MNLDDVVGGPLKLISGLDRVREPYEDRQRSAGALV